jgi:hypothetical protein
MISIIGNLIWINLPANYIAIKVNFVAKNSQKGSRKNKNISQESTHNISIKGYSLCHVRYQTNI